MRTKWMITLLGISVTLSLLVTGCGGGESIRTPAAGGTSGVVSTQDGSQTGGGEEAGNTNTMANEAGITTSPTTATGLSADLERQIKKDYVEYCKAEVSDPTKYVSSVYQYYQNMTIDNVTIQTYCGTYSGCVAMFITHDDASYYTVVTQEIVAGYLFEYGSSHTLTIYKDGEFSDVKSAYEKGWITREDVKTLAGGKTAPAE